MTDCPQLVAIVWNPPGHRGLMALAHDDALRIFARDRFDNEGDFGIAADAELPFFSEAPSVVVWSRYNPGRPCQVALDQVPIFGWCEPIVA